MTRPGRCVCVGGGGRFLQSVLPDLFSAAGVRRTLDCLWVLASEQALRPGTRRAMPRSSGPRAGFLGPARSAQMWPGPGAGGGSPFPHQFLLDSYPRSLGSGEEDSNGVQVLCFLLKLPGKTLEAAEGRRAGRGRGRVRGGAGEAPLAVRIRHRDRRTRGTILSLRGPHGGDTANTILNNPARQAEGHGAQRQPRTSTPHSRAPLAGGRELGSTSCS